MAKALKTVASVAVGVALVATGVGALAGAGVLGASVGTAGLAAAAAGVAKIAGYAAISAGLGASALQRKPRIEATGGGITGRLEISDQIDDWLAVGETALPSAIVYWATGGGENKELSIILCHACHEIDSFTGLNINGVATAFPTPTGDYAGILSIETATGAQTANPFTDVQGGLWDASCIGRGRALSHFRWTFNQDKLASGLPQNIQFIARGIRVYDPRRDSTVGGSGTMRANDQSTWAYSVGSAVLGDNPALVHLSYRLGWRKAGKLWAGMGDDPAAINYAEYIAAANICDETVAGEKRYRIAGLLSLAEQHNVNLGNILACCAGRQTDAGGLLGIWVAVDDTAVATMSFNGGDIIGDVQWEPLPDQVNRNTARGSFLDSGNGWTTQPYLEVAPADLLALDNAAEQVDRLDFPRVPSARQARRLASVRLRESRQGVAVLPMRLKALGVKPAAVIALTLPQQGWTAKRFRVEGMTLDGETVNLRCRAVAASDYGDVTGSPITPAAPLPTSGYLPTFADGATRNRPRGTYDGATTYERGDGVIFAGSSYELIVASSTGNAPPDAAFWALTAAAGTGVPGADGLEGITVFVTNEAHVVPTAPDGSGGSYSTAGGTMIVRRGATALSPTFSIAAQSPNTGWASIDASTGVYTITDPGAVLGTATLRATVAGVNYDRTYTIAKTLQGVDGPNLTLVADAQAFTFTDGVADPGGQVVTLQALLTNLAGTATWATTPSVTLGGSGNTRTLSAANFGTNRQVTVQATLGGITDRITVVRLERNIAAPANANLVPFSRFERGMGDWPVTVNSSGVTPPTLAAEVEGRRVGAYDATFTAGGQTFAFRSTVFPLPAGDAVSVQGRVGVEGIASIAGWSYFIFYFDQSGGFIGADTVASGTTLPGWRDPPKRNFFARPPTARTAYVQFNVNSNVAGDALCVMSEPMVSPALLGQTAHPDWVPGPNAQDGATVGAPAGTLVGGQEASALVADAATAKSGAASALSSLAAIADDAVLDAGEKPAVRQQRQVIIDEFPVIRDRADAFGVSRVTYATAYTNLIDYLDVLSLSSPTNTGIVRSVFNGRFTDYFAARQAVLDGIAARATAASLPALPQGELSVGSVVSRGETWNYLRGTWVALADFTAASGNFPPNGSFWRLFTNAADSSAAVAAATTRNSATFAQEIVVDVRAGPTGVVEISCELDVGAEADNGASYLGGGKWRREITPGSGSYTDVMAEVLTGSIAPGGSAALDTSVTVSGLTPGSLHRFDLQLRRAGAGPGTDELFFTGIANLQGL